MSSQLSQAFTTDPTVWHVQGTVVSPGHVCVSQGTSLPSLTSQQSSLPATCQEADGSRVVACNHKDCAIVLNTDQTCLQRLWSVGAPRAPTRLPSCCQSQAGRPQSRKTA